MLVYTAILIPMYPATMEVRDPRRYEVAVYGKLVAALASFISRESTVNPRTSANKQDQIPRYRYSLYKKD